jgi:hypothetical protein
MDALRKSGDAVRIRELEKGGIHFTGYSSKPANLHDLFISTSLTIHRIADQVIHCTQDAGIPAPVERGEFFRSMPQGSAVVEANG